MNNSYYPDGVYSLTLNNIPEYGKVRVVYTDEYQGRVYDDKIKEFIYNDIMENPELYSIKRRLQ